MVLVIQVPHTDFPAVLIYLQKIIQMKFVPVKNLSEFYTHFLCIETHKCSLDQENQSRVRFQRYVIHPGNVVCVRLAEHFQLLEQNRKRCYNLLHTRNTRFIHEDQN
jgi:hypothetical protein